MIFLSGNLMSAPGAQRAAPLPLVRAAPAPAPPPTVSVTNALLLNFNGTNGSATFTDSSPNAAVPAVFGGAVLTTDPTKRTFGSAAGDFSASADTYIRFAASAALRLIRAFTVRFTLIPSLSDLKNRFIIGTTNDAWHLWFKINQDGFLECYAGGYQAASTILPVASTKYYLMVTRNSAGLITWSINGNLQPALGINTTDHSNNTYWEIGAFPTGAGPGRGCQGYIDELQILSEFGSTNRAPPTSEFTQPQIELA